jgi:hypothetical protein
MAEIDNRRLAVNLLMGILFCDFVMLDLLSGFDSYNIRDNKERRQTKGQ